MKIAVTSQGKTLDSKLDPRFGRASFILIVDTETLEFEAFDNAKNKNAFKGAGIQAAAMIADMEAARKEEGSGCLFWFSDTKGKLGINKHVDFQITGQCIRHLFSQLDYVSVEVAAIGAQWP